MLFGRKNRTNTNNIPGYNPETHRPILRCSICTGEQVAGFKEIRTGKFEEVMLVRNSQELREFMEKYGISEVTKVY